MNFKLFSHKILVSAILALTMGTTPVRAGVLDEFFNSSSITDVYKALYEDVIGFSEQMNNYIVKIGEDFQITADLVLGDMGFIDRDKFIKEFREHLYNNPELDAAERVIIENDVSTQLNRLQTREASRSVLSEAGQERSARKIAFNEAIVAEVEAQANTAFNATSTHDAIKAMAKITADQVSMQSALHIEMLENKQAQALANQNIADIQESMSITNRSQYIENVGSALSLLESAPSLNSLY